MPHIQPRTPHNIVTKPLLPDLLLPVRDITILTTTPGAAMRIHQLREHTNAPEIPRPILAHLADAEIDGTVVIRHTEVEEDFLRAAVAESVGVEAGAAVGGVHDARGVVVVRHVWDCAKVKAVIEGGCGGVVFEEDAAGVGLDGGEGAVAEPEEVPVVAVG